MIYDNKINIFLIHSNCIIHNLYIEMIVKIIYGEYIEEFDI